MPLVIGVTKEFTPGERRVALVPDVAKKYQGLGAALLLQAGAGASAYHRDEDYGAAELEADAGPVLAKADVILQVQPLGLEEIAQLKPGAVLVGKTNRYILTQHFIDIRKDNLKGVQDFFICFKSHRYCLLLSVHNTAII